MEWSRVSKARDKSRETDKGNLLLLFVDHIIYKFNAGKVSGMIFPEPILPWIQYRSLFSTK